MPTTEEVRPEISDWLSEEICRDPKGKHIAAIAAPVHNEEHEWEETYVYFAESGQLIL